MQVFELRAFSYDGLAMTTRPDPVPQGTQVLLRMKATALNYRDLLLLRGHYNPHLSMPRIPLCDGVGSVVACGPEVQRYKVDDRVLPCFFTRWIDGDIAAAKVKLTLGSEIDGTLCELMCVDESGLVAAPAFLDDTQASTLPCAALTAWNALAVQAHVQPGDTVLILGTGGVALFALQFARLMGARVIVTSGSDAKLERARQLGAHLTLNHREHPEFGKIIRRMTEDRGVDYVLEVGGAQTLPQSLIAVRHGGTIGLIGVLAGFGGFDPLSAIMKSIRIQGILVGSRAMLEDMCHAIELHRIEPVIDRVFPFEAAVDALHYLEAAGHFGKICIQAPA